MEGLVMRHGDSIDAEDTCKDEEKKKNCVERDVVEEEVLKVLQRFHG